MTEYSLAWRGARGGHGRTDIILPTNGWVWIIYHVLIPGSTQRVGLAALLYLLLLCYWLRSLTTQHWRNLSDWKFHFCWTVIVSSEWRPECMAIITNNSSSAHTKSAHMGGWTRMLLILLQPAKHPCVGAGREGGRGVIMPCKGSIIMRTSYNDRDMS